MRGNAFRRAVLLAALAPCTLVAVPGGVGQAAPKHGPSLSSPRDQASSDVVPAFSWKRVKGADRYEFQLAADPQFESTVLGRNRGSFQTRNTFATIDATLPNGAYYWRVRSINARGDASRWSRTRTIDKSWDQRPTLLSPIGGETIAYPNQPLVLRWDRVPRAFKYLLWIGTDPTLASVDRPIETQATVYSPQKALPPGRYYWAVTPLDAQEHAGVRSAVGSFDWAWPSATTPRVSDLQEDARVLDPQFSWDPVPGAAKYEVEINPSVDFATGSKVCCTETPIGTSLSPKKVLPNNTYYWRMRAVDIDGNAGQWNNGPPFKKAFDDVAPTIPNLRMRDNVSENPSDPDPATPQLDTANPIVTWDPVPGASSYQVQVAPYTGVFCNWTALSTQKWDTQTASTSWTPLARAWNSQKPGVESAGVSYDPGKSGPTVGTSYCVRVLARADRDAKGGEVLSEWTQLGGLGNPAFKYVAPTQTPLPPGPNFTMPGADAYTGPPAGSVQTRMPLFTWQPIDGAGSYFIVVARDAAFTKVVDVALTEHPMYAPRLARTAQTYADETTSYYWAVVPAQGSNGASAGSLPTENHPRPFEKYSIPPAPSTPADGEDVARTPVFRWAPVEGARNYRIQVASDASFSNLLDDVTTAATSYTSEDTYPADTVLYWRVRANDENNVGLNWSSVSTFRRRLPVPRLDAGNPTDAEQIPAFRWEPVEGATSYDLHVDQSDGTKKDFRISGTAFTPTLWFGTGIWAWQVRANFPAGGTQQVSGGYTSAQPVVRHIATPGNLRTINSEKHVLMEWDPAAEAKRYRVEVSDTDSFTRVVERITTDHTSWAPLLTNPMWDAGGTMYWRVAAIDSGDNVGAWRSSQLVTKRGFTVSATGVLQRGKRGKLKVKVLDGKRRGVRGARVAVSGVARARARRTSRSGAAVFSLRPRKRGSVVITVSKRGYRSAKATIRAR